MTKKRVPNPISVLILLMGFFFGSVFGGLIVVIGFITNSVYGVLTVWAIMAGGSMVVVQIILLKYRALLVEWGLSKEKKRKKQ